MREQEEPSTIYFRMLAILAFGLILSVGSALAAFQDDFTGQTMRVDYFHSGNAVEDHIALDRIVADGPWAGDPDQLLDDLDLGPYRFEVLDLKSQRVLYSRGFASIYGEWQTTPEAKGSWGTFHESIRFPWPKRPVQVVLKKRDANNLFREFWTYSIDPDSRFVVKANVKAPGQVWTLFENGAPAHKVDLLVLGDGYTAEQMAKFHKDVTRLIGALFAQEPFKSRKQDFNVRAIDLPAAQSGVSRPRAGIFRRSPLSTHYNSLDSERYVLTYDNRTVRDIASAAPYDYLVILVNERTYGGGGIFNCFATAAADNSYADYLLVHEFGHLFAGLGDEYYTSDVAYTTGQADRPEPWEPNLTALHDPAKLKWKDLVEAGTPLPTPWDKAEFERLSASFQEKRQALRASHAPEEEVEKLFREEEATLTKLLSTMKYSGKVGAFEGAGYESKGLYRPTTDCIMFTRDKVGFCPVCQRAIIRIIDQYTQ